MKFSFQCYGSPDYKSVGNLFVKRIKEENFGKISKRDMIEVVAAELHDIVEGLFPSDAEIYVYSHGVKVRTRENKVYLLIVVEKIKK